MTVPNYITLADVKAYMPNNEVSNTTKWDTFVTTLCTNLSRAFDTLTWREPGEFAVSADSTFYFDGVPATATIDRDKLLIGELAQAPTSISLSTNGDPSGFVVYPSANYFLWPYNAGVTKPFTRIDMNTFSGLYKVWPSAQRSIQIVGRFGYSIVVPPDVFEAMLLFAVRFIRKAQQNYLDTGTLLDTGQVMSGMKPDDDFKTLLLYYRKSRL